MEGSQRQCLSRSSKTAANKRLSQRENSAEHSGVSASRSSGSGGNSGSEGDGINDDANGAGSPSASEPGPESSPEPPLLSQVRRFPLTAPRIFGRGSWQLGEPSVTSLRLIRYQTGSLSGAVAPAKGQKTHIAVRCAASLMCSVYPAGKGCEKARWKAGGEKENGGK